MEAWVVCVSSQMKIGSDKEDYHQIKLICVEVILMRLLIDFEYWTILLKWISVKKEISLMTSLGYVPIYFNYPLYK